MVGTSKQEETQRKKENLVTLPEVIPLLWSQSPLGYAVPLLFWTGAQLVPGTGIELFATLTLQLVAKLIMVS